ncbi:MAG TPA: MATE family efflux transporter [Ilumatobacteraceae bacterium]|nr:MATE family efflux transporter [Ilumatobacteraceae bacterium]
MSRPRPAGLVGRFLDPADRRLVALAIPALGTLAVEPLYVLVDTAIVGRLGTPQLAGLALAATVLSFVVFGSNFLAYGTTERVARRVGAGDHPGAADVGVQALWLSVLFGVPAAALLVVGAEPICRLLGGSGDALGHATDYLQISAVGIPFVLVTLAAQGVLRGVSAYYLPLFILFVSNLVNTVLEVFFVYGLDLGIPGSAWSTVIAQAMAAVAFGVVIRPHLIPALTRRPAWAGMAPLANAGRHLVLRVSAMLAVFGGSTAIAARIDEPTLAAHQIVIGLFSFVSLSLDALAVPAQTLVAEDLGRGDMATARNLASRAVRLSLASATLLAVVIAASAPWLPNVFTGDAAVASRATTALWFLAVMMFPAAVAFAHDGVLIGAGDYRFLGRAAVGYLVAVAPLAAIVLVFRDLGIAGIWAAFTVWMVIRAVANHHRTNHILRV